MIPSGASMATDDNDDDDDGYLDVDEMPGV